MGRFYMKKAKIAIGQLIYFCFNTGATLYFKTIVDEMKKNNLFFDGGGRLRYDDLKELRRLTNKGEASDITKYVFRTLDEKLPKMDHCDYFLHIVLHLNHYDLVKYCCQEFHIEKQVFRKIFQDRKEMKWHYKIGKDIMEKGLKPIYVRIHKRAKKKFGKYGNYYLKFYIGK